LIGVGRKSLIRGQNDANDHAPRGRELSVREDLTRIIVDWSGSWQAARPAVGCWPPHPLRALALFPALGGKVAAAAKSALLQ